MIDHDRDERDYERIEQAMQSAAKGASPLVIGAVLAAAMAKLIYALHGRNVAAQDKALDDLVGAAKAGLASLGHRPHKVRVN